MGGLYGGLAALLLLATACGDDDTEAAETGDPPTTTTTTAPATETVPCDDTVPDDPRVECGVLTVDDGVTIPYAVLGTADPAARPDPIIYFSGGPGGPGRDIAAFLYEIGIAGGARDVIVFDQRGTGASTPSLDCPEYTDAIWQLLGAAAPAAEELAVSDAAHQACHDRLVDEGVDLDAYDTPATAADVEALRVALGIDEWNIFGVSYGTTVAFEVVRQHPESVRSATFDSAYPPDQPTDAAEVVEQAEDTLAVLAAGCAADAGCAAAHGDVLAGLHELAGSWNADPYETTITDPADGQPRNLVINGDDIVAGLWNAMYDDELIPLLPSLIAPLLARDPLTDVVIQQLATDGIALLTDGAEGMGLAVDCADRQRLNAAASTDVIEEEAFYASLVVLGDRPCELWDVQSVDPAFNEPVTSELPSLFFGNEYDPVTPKADTEAAAARFPNGTYLEVPRLGHGAVFGDRCPTGVFLAFVEDPAAALDTSCIDAMGAPAWAL